MTIFKSKKYLNIETPQYQFCNSKSIKEGRSNMCEKHSTSRMHHGKKLELKTINVAMAATWGSH